MFCMCTRKKHLFKTEHVLCMFWVNTMVRKPSCIEPTQKSRPYSSIFCIDNYYCCACSKTSISINKYIQKAGEPEDDAGFLKHIAS